MKLSDKALRLIGLTILGGMQNKKIQDDSKHSPGSRKPAGYGRPRLTAKTRSTLRKAPVLPLRSKKSTH
jgi:hypothetical protein